MSDPVPGSLRAVIDRSYMACMDEGGVEHPALADASREKVMEVGYRMGFLNALQWVATAHPSEWVHVANEAARIDQEVP